LKVKMRVSESVAAAAIVIAGAIMGSCSSSEKSEPTVAVAPVSHFKVTEATLAGSSYTVAGLTFQAPSDWIDLGPSGMRKAQYAFGPIEGETDSSTLAVFYFGQAQGGTTQANIDRWIGQIAQPDGTDSKQKAVASEHEIKGMKVHVVELSGTLLPGRMGMGNSEELPGYRLTGVVVDGPEGSLFFKITGPDKTAAAMTGGLATMLEGITLEE